MRERISFGLGGIVNKKQSAARKKRNLVKRKSRRQNRK